jgi:hypothetical protein
MFNDIIFEGKDDEFDMAELAGVDGMCSFNIDDHLDCPHFRKRKGCDPLIICRYYIVGDGECTKHR